MKVLEYSPDAGACASRGRMARSLSWLRGQLSRETSSGRFIPEMDGLRFVAISMVILFHLNGYLAVKSAFARTPQLASDWLANVALVGFRGVELFFVISGFILGLPFAAHYLEDTPAVNLRKYYLRRLTRLEPPYIVALLLLFVLAVALQGISPSTLMPHLWASLAYMHNLAYGSPSMVMGVAWSLEIEIQFYLLVPLLTCLFAIRHRGTRRLCMAGLILSILAIQRILFPQDSRVSLSILGSLQYFLTGFLLADIFLTDWKQAPEQCWRWDLVALAGWPLLFFVLRSNGLTHWLLPFLILLLYYAAFRGFIFHRFFSNPWITAVGGMCYSIYLLHYEVISAVARWTRGFGQLAPYWLYLMLQFALVGAAILLFCGTYFVLIEKPCMRRDWPQRLRAQSEKLFLPARRMLGSSGAD